MPEARRQLIEIFDDILTVASPRSAGRVVDRIERRCRSLTELPERGRTYAHPRLHHLRRLVELPYVIVYEVRNTEVEIVAILHGSRNIEAKLLETRTD